MNFDLTAELKESFCQLRRRLSPRVRRSLRRLASHLQKDEDVLFGEIAVAAFADMLRRGAADLVMQGGDDVLGLRVDLLIRDVEVRRRFERRFLRYHLRHRQRLVRPTWASIFVNRLSPETCALWVKSERESDRRFRPSVDLGKVVYLPEDAFRRYERDILLPALRQMASAGAGAERDIAGAFRRN